MKKVIFCFIAALFFLLNVRQAYANVPIGGAAFLAYPTMSYLASSAVALFIVLVIESLIFLKIAKTKPLQTIFIVLAANLFSSLFGVLIVFSFSSMATFLIMLIPTAYILSNMLKSISKSLGHFTKSAKYSFIPLIFLLLLCLVDGILLLPATDVHMYKIRSEPNITIVLACSVAMITMGFLITIIIELFTVHKIKRLQTSVSERTQIKAVLLMNLASYVVLSVIYGESIFNLVLKAS